MRAIMVCVDYQDLLAVSLPYNRHHFDQICIVTDGRNYNGVRRVVDTLPDKNDQNYIFTTEAFYSGGATFNKWAALEEGLDWYGRHGWLCLMDADVLWPKGVKLDEDSKNLYVLGSVPRPMTIQRHQLCSPLRRMAPWPPDIYPAYAHKINSDGEWKDADTMQLIQIPDENEWRNYPIHRNTAEWAGYSQIFHANDPVLGSPPWHEVDWVHAGGADSMFQRKWPRDRKIRPPFEVLHLGLAGENWMGRATPYADGTKPENAEELRTKMQGVWVGRRKAGPGRFEQEKIK